MKMTNRIVNCCCLVATVLLVGRLSSAQGAQKPSDAEAVQQEREPTATDDKTGVTAKIARWYDNKEAAVSLRFDDSHPSHILIAVPLLTKYDMVGTFLINPGKDRYLGHKQEWESDAVRGGHEFGNHTMHHRGAKDDDQADDEIGECSKHIWNLFPCKSKVLAFRSGGGTTWNIAKPWSYYHEKWHLISAPNSASVGTSPEACKIADLDTFKRYLERTVEDRDWISFYYHTIGAERSMAIAERAFRDQVRYLRSRRREIWFGGIAQVHKYREERRKAKIEIQAVEPFKLKIDVTCETDPELYDQPLTVWIGLPEGRWPVEDIQALDGDGRPIPMRRRSDKWNEPMLSVAPVSATYFIHAVEPTKVVQRDAWPKESQRTVKDQTTGIEATICKWFDGKRTALSQRFDDSHPTHILKAVPILRDYGFRGTFIINPGNGGYLKHEQQWQAVAKRGDQEFGNHTLHHRGAKNDEEVEYEIGECAQVLCKLFPNKSKLVNFSRGGGTTWTHTKPFRYWLDKYHLEKMYFERHSPPAHGISMADSYGDRVAGFRKILALGLEHGRWIRLHYHGIGSSGGLGISEENFLAVQEMIEQHQEDLWTAGMADIFMYYTERESSGLSIKSLGDKETQIRLSCATDGNLYEQPLTLQLTLPEAWTAAGVTASDAKGNQIKTRTATVDARKVVRFDVDPVDGTFVVRSSTP